MAHNDEHLAPGAGYATHTHRETEIVTVVLSGALRHSSEVGEALLGPGDVQRLSAGTGVTHAETNEDAGATTRFVQTWLRPQEAGLRPAYHLERGALGETTRGPLRTLPPGVVTVGGSELHLARVAATASVTLPQAPLVHLFVADGSALLRAGGESTTLADGDAARLDGPGPVSVEALTEVTVLAWCTTRPG